MPDILNRLEEYCSADYVPMHMPGGKRNTEILKMSNPYGLDITEIDGFDNMHNSHGIIKDAFNRAAKVFGADHTFFLVNGSSAGLMAAICGVTNKGDKVLVARNTHISISNALYINELTPVYIYPKEAQFNGIKCGIADKVTSESVENYLKSDSKIKAVIITSPTYEGIVSDIHMIANICHKYKVVLIVDEAHGAHLHFHEEFPESAVDMGADVVIQSIHKTLPSFTQTALLHINEGLVDVNKIKRYWDMFQTTSPSYILMAGIDRCITIMEDSEYLMNSYIKNVKNLREKLSGLKNIRLLNVDDISKIVLYCNDGKALYNELLDKYHIQLEMASEKYVVAMTSLADKEEYYHRFAKALEQIDERYENSDVNVKSDYMYSLLDNEVVVNAYEAMNCETTVVELEKSVGKISATRVCFYPPGIPVINPGERISKELVDIITTGLSKNLEVMGLELDEDKRYMNIGEVKILCMK